VGAGMAELSAALAESAESGEADATEMAATV
jgi:hypothetical protein